MPRVLIIDDHPVVREGIGRVLTSSLPDVEIGEAAGAAEAQEMMHARAWDLVMLDLTLAGDDGTVVLRRLRQTHPDVPVVIISMHPAEQFARRVLQAGAVSYVSKGCNPEELVRAVRAALNGIREPVAAPARGRADHASLPHEQL